MLKPNAPCMNCGPEDRTDSCHTTCEAYLQYVKDNEVYKKLNKYEDYRPIYTEGRIHILNRNIKGGKH